MDSERKTKHRVYFLTFHKAFYQRARNESGEDYKSAPILPINRHRPYSLKADKTRVISQM